MNLTEAREKVEALQGLYSDAEKPMVFKSAVLAILEEKFIRTKSATATRITTVDVPNEREGQRRVEGRRAVNELTRRSGYERRRTHD